MVVRIRLACVVALTAGCGSFDAAPIDAGAAPDARDADTSAPADDSVARYTFTEGSGAVVHDVSGVEPALDLNILDKAAATWGADGLTLGAPVLVDSITPATKIFDACAVTDAVTVETWIRPGVAAQGGPARVVTMSTAHNEQNFLLGIGENDASEPSSRYVLRLAAPLGPFVATAVGIAETELQHVVATAHFGSRALAIYVDGTPVGSAPLSGTVAATWSRDRPLVLGGERGLSDRHFLGTYEFLAIYARALSRDEVAQRFAAGPRR